MLLSALLATLTGATSVIDVDLRAPMPPTPFPTMPPACFNSSMCPTGQACHYPAGNCGFDGSPGNCTVKPTVCPMVVIPVCGCDDVTYSNACKAARAGVSVQYNGACSPTPKHCYDSSQCNGTVPMMCVRPVGTCLGTFANGNCTIRPGACPLLYKPVCGCDGVTYTNECFAQAAGQNTAYNGACKVACTNSSVCKMGDFCEFAVGLCSGSGTCASKPQICTHIYFPCCACDGTTYSNSCYATANGTQCIQAGPCP